MSSANHKNVTPDNRLPEVEREVATALAKVAYFISPKIVNRICESNREWNKVFESEYGLKVSSPDYFYIGSACVFPGVRRMADKTDRSHGSPQKYYEKAKAILDFNWFPREIWCFVCTGKSYSAKLWRESGLGQFELAHILPHKQTELDGVKKFFRKTPDKISAGLFTCGSNVALLPKGMTRPTDGTAGIRASFLRRYFDLYGDTFSGGFAGFDLPGTVTWYDEMSWNPPVEPLDWENRVKLLDEFRRRRIKNLLGKIISNGTN